MSSIKYNASKTYLLPLLSEIIGFEPKFMNYLENTYMYVDDESLDQSIPYLAVLHEFSFKNPEFTSYEHRLIDNQLFIKCIDIEDNVLYIFKFPEEYLTEYELLKDSKYSEFGEDAKKLILNFWTQLYGKIPVGINLILKIKQILYKDTKLREQIETKLKTKLDSNSELGEHVYIENETFKIEKIVKH